MGELYGGFVKTCHQMVFVAGVLFNYCVKVFFISQKWFTITHNQVLSVIRLRILLKTNTQTKEFSYEPYQYFI